MLLLTNCSQEHDIFSNNEKVETIITATSDGHRSQDSRTQVGDVAFDGHLVMQWSKNDYIGVFGKSVNNVQFISTNTEPSDKATFAGTIPGTSTPEKAYYPYVEGALETAIPVNIPSVQEYTDVNSVAAYDYKAASSCTHVSEGNYVMNFRQMVTMLRLQINLSTAEGLAVNEKLQSVKMTCPFDISGSYTYDLNNLDAGLTKVGASDNKSVTLNFTGQPLLSETNFIAYAVIVPGGNKGDMLDFEITTDKHLVKFSSQLLCDIRPGVFYDLPLNATVLTNNAAVIEEVIPEPTPEPTEETANCYMINTTGEHDFCATQIGNGDKGIIPGVGFHVTSSKINPKSAKLMWQDVENFIDVNSIRLENGRVHYTANKNSGNAMIAVYSGDNCTGDILWSWHIWGVGDEMPGDDIITNQAGATFTVMNRTLGTHNANSYFATLYQWGRKDPFPNSSVYYLADGSKVDISSKYPSYKPTSNNVTIETSVRRCDQLIECYDWNISSNWLNNENQYLWGDNNLKDNFSWSGTGLSNPEAGAGWTNQKTIYDPSPVGYRVANKFTFSGFVNRNDGTADITGTMNEGSIEEWLNVITEPRPGQKPDNYIFWWPKFNNGYYFKRSKTDKEGSYFPNTGERYSSGKMNNAGVAGFYVYSAPSQNKSENNYMYISPYEWKDKATHKAGNQGNVHVIEFGQKRNARAIRCVRE